jgi:aspartate/methionine/tyrosine aminotransferase
MRYRLNAQLADVAPPPIAEAQNWVAERRPDGRALLDLAQAVPADPPPEALRQHLAEETAKPAGHGYTPILGRPDLRAAIARHMAGHYAGRVDAEQVAVTAGCNQAFCYAISAVAGPGDEVILPVPYYFNHQMWLEMQGVRPVHLPCEMDAGARPDPDRAEALIGPSTRAIVLVTPNNPTGAVYPPELIAAFFDLARRRGLALIVDETYKDFLPDDRSPHDLLARGDWPDALIQLYSFSKTYSLTGHRLGAMLAHPDTLAAVAKVADCVAICPPVGAQAAGLYALRELQDHRRNLRRRMAERVAALRTAFDDTSAGGYALVSAGAYFAYLRHPFDGVDAHAVARALVRDQGVLALPGNMFGPGQAAYLRLAFANLGENAFPELVRRLRESREAPTCA